MIGLEGNNPDVYNQFHNGNFSVQMSCTNKQIFHLKKGLRQTSVLYLYQLFIVDITINSVDLL